MKSREKWAALGLCSSCGKQPPRKDRTKCQKCHDCVVVAQRKSRQKKKESGLCVSCGKASVKNTTRCKRCAEINNCYSRKLYAVIRHDVIHHYGGKCLCCGETEPDFLSIDHTNNDGAEHRRQIKNRPIYSWLKANNYPEGFGLLCHNCNMAKGLYGICPHQRHNVDSEDIEYEECI